MKINTKKNTTRVIVLSVALFLLLSGLAYSYYAFTTKGSSDHSINYNPPTEKEKQAGDEIKDRTVESTDNKPSGSDPLPRPADQQDGSKPVVGIDIVATTRNSDGYRVQTFIQTVTNSGQCKLIVTDSAGKTYRAVADVQALPSSSTCKGFTIPVNELSAGNWSINLQFENESVRGSVEKDMEVS